MEKGYQRESAQATEITEMTNDVENELIWNTIICILFVKQAFCEPVFKKPMNGVLPQFIDFFVYSLFIMNFTM